MIRGKYRNGISTDIVIHWATKNYVLQMGTQKQVWAVSALFTPLWDEKKSWIIISQLNYVCTPTYTFTHIYMHAHMHTACCRGQKSQTME